MADRYSITIDAIEVNKALQDLSERGRKGVEVTGNTVGQCMKTYAQTNGPWEDRTGDARQELDYKVTWEGATLDIAIFHQMDYGLWLEKRQSFQGKYKILEDARDSQIQTLKDMLKNLGL